MPGLIPQHLIDDVRAHSEIAEVVGERVPLKPAGSTLKALCPFHKEKTPSFNVNRQRQTFHCFGCGEGGDVFAFIMRYEGVDFLTAVQMLAQRANIVLEFTESERKDRHDKNALYDLLEKTAGLYHRALLESPAAAEARAYLKERALDGDLARTYRLGYAPDRRDAVVSWAREKGFSLRQLEAAGLAGADSSHGAYDRFRDRVMFPICDELSRVIGFSGRLLKSGTHPAKYINSPETPVFKKSRVLYGLDKARRAVTERREALLCEGQIDVIRCHAAGFQHAVAPQGTALTDDHARLIKRYADSALLLFDSDPAGVKAALRSAEVLIADDIDVRLASLPEGEDPDSLLTREGPPALQTVLDGARELVDFQLDVLARDMDLASQAGQRKAAQAVVALAGRTPSEVRREQILQRAAARLGLHASALQQDVRRLSRGRYTASSSPPEELPGRPAAPPADEVALLEVLLQDDGLIGEAHRFVALHLLEHPASRAVLDVLYEEQSAASLLTRLADQREALALVARLQAEARLTTTTDSSLLEALHEIILSLRKKALLEERRRLVARQAEADEQESTRLARRCSEMTMEIKQLGQGWNAAEALLELHND